MLSRSERILENIPVGSLGIIPLLGCEELGNKVNDYLVKWRRESAHEHKNDVAFSGYEKENYLINASVPRFGSGEAKGILGESVRGKDIYLMVDVCNYNVTYSLTGNTNHMSPDDHFQNLKRIIAAVGGKGRRINVIMPFLYESRQHKRTSRESLDCALALQELVRMGVDNIITFDAHDPRVSNAIPLSGFETISPTYQFIKGLLRNVKDLQIDSEHMMAISPDEGGTNRAVYLANVLGLDMGMFYKRRDYTQIVNGRNPIVAHEFLGSSVEGKDVIIIDDMISSGDSIIEVATELKRRKAKRILENIPVGSLGIIPLLGCEELGNKVNDYLVKWRRESAHEHKNDVAFSGYEKENYLINASVPRFGSGEAKGILGESVRGKDIYLMVDVCNYNVTYSLTGNTNHMSPDDHFQNLKRIIAAVGGKGRRINVIMPFLYESRQHKRTSRESLDCALALQELVRMGVDNIITFDAHDPRVSNAIPLSGFETISPTYQFIKGLLRNVKDLQIDSEHMMAISPDEGGTNRAVYLANVLGLDMGMFYKRRDYTQIVNGRNPIVAHEFLGSSVEGKDVIIIDDMISSGDSIIEVATELKRRKANRIFAAATFGLFTNGMEKFDKAYEEGIINGILTTNLIYQTPNLLSKPYYINCDMSKYIALIIDTLNHDGSLSEILSPNERIQNVLQKYKNGETI